MNAKNREEAEVDTLDPSLLVRTAAVGSTTSRVSRRGMESMLLKTKRTTKRSMLKEYLELLGSQ